MPCGDRGLNLLGSSELHKVIELILYSLVIERILSTLNKYTVVMPYISPR